jgi:hypothetical protein
MSKDNGRFYFRKTLDGNLIGEFLNNGPAYTCTESADLIFKKGEKDFEKRQDFVGEYNTTWYEGKACSAKLKITKQKDKDEYDLEWTDGAKLTGQGRLSENNLLLIGNYWSS